MSGFYPHYNLQDRIQHTKLVQGFGGIPSARLDGMGVKKTGDFQTVFTGMVEKFNNELNAPDELLKDVMIAMSKSEISVNVATTAVGKVIQAYDRIMQIQV